MSDLGNKAIFAENLCKYVEASGKTKKELAEIVGVAQSTFIEWTKGKKYPRMDKVEILANYFKIRKSDLIERKPTEQTKKDNDIMSDIIVHMRADVEFFELVQTLTNLDRDKISSVKQFLNTFIK